MASQTANIRADNVVFKTERWTKLEKISSASSKIKWKTTTKSKRHGAISSDPYDIDFTWEEGRSLDIVRQCFNW